MKARASTHVVSSDSTAYRLVESRRVLACALVVACGVDQAEEQFGTGTYEAKRTRPARCVEPDPRGQGLQLHLVSYTPAAALDSDTAVDTAKAQILDTNRNGGAVQASTRRRSR